MILTVSALTKYIKSILEQDKHLSSVLLEGEISNFTNHRASGHFYFSLKDEGAVISAVMFRSAAQALPFLPENGMRVIVSGRVSVYEKSGQYQIYVNQMQPAGVGALHLAFEQMKKRLAAEGLFDPAHKRPLPRFPQRIGIITSKSGAAVHDMLNILSRRYPVAEVIVHPALVQGEGAVDSLCAALDWFEKNRGADVILLGRGGGSIEDLWAFNEEKLARKVYSMTIPVISAVGHETDTTICDFVADLRAPTPSAAAELAAPDLQKVRAALQETGRRLETILRGKTTRWRVQLEAMKKRRAFSDPEAIFGARRMLLDSAASAVCTAATERTREQKHRLGLLAQRLDDISPLRVLARGYLFAADQAGGRVASVRQLAAGERVLLTLRDGKAACRVEEITEEYS